ncbi:SDR family NAD(P)-dependent oxidoreductase [Lysinibacillus sp. NPDC093712]|uniref:SDR family NAD(P)-dependent oxidoreductase n=1 Tax=Lysinibacillus sp. NPDC093712 TaxID=3390579 RepID=UPI003D06ADF4
MLLKGNTTFITGASGGLGSACAKLFAKQGSNLVLFDKNENIIKLAEEIGTNVIAFVGDVTNEKDLQEAIALGITQFGSIENMVCCSGIVRAGTVTETEKSDWQHVFDVNVLGVYLSCKAVLPTMETQKYGRIVTVSSHFGLVGAPRLSAYIASKGAVIQLTKSIALDYGKKNIRANCLCPGMMKSDMFKDIIKQVGSSREWVDLMRGLPNGELEPDDIAKSALFLVSSAADTMSGSVFVADGGYTAR